MLPHDRECGLIAGLTKSLTIISRAEKVNTKGQWQNYELWVRWI
jgi:hypothetical protein